ncbi:hypothetical protein FRB91_004522 [Serendipita sp. 411]|nr:hypothetical protein FRB91_004522 [Serendipita sp. 411]
MAGRRHSSIFGPAFAFAATPVAPSKPRDATLPSPPVSPFRRASTMWSTMDDLRVRANDDIAPDQIDPRSLGPLPSNVLQNIFQEVVEEGGRKDLFNVLVASKAMYNEVQKALYHTVAFSSAEVLETIKRPYPYLSKVTIPHEYAKAIIPLAPSLRHLALSFDSTTTSFDLSKTFTQLPLTIESLVLNTTRRDFLTAHAFLPRSLRMLSTVFVAEEATLLLQYLTPLKYLEHVILNVCQASVPSFINPFALGAAPPSPSLMQGVSDVTVDGFVSKLKSLCPSIKAVEVDDQVFQRKGSVWQANDGGRMLRKEIYEINRHADGSAARKWSISH